MCYFILFCPLVVFLLSMVHSNLWHIGESPTEKAQKDDRKCKERTKFTHHSIVRGQKHSLHPIFSKHNGTKKKKQPNQQKDRQLNQVKHVNNHISLLNQPRLLRQTV